MTPRLVSHFMSRLYPIVRGVRAIQQWRGRAAGAAGTDFSQPPGPLNRLLTAVLAGEAAQLLAAVQAPEKAYRQGVSLVALLRREAGVIQPAGRPADVAADRRQVAAAAGDVGDVVTADSQL